MVLSGNTCRRGALAALVLAAMVAPAPATVHVVQQVGNTFDPADITALPGDTVRWVWTSGIHTVTSGSNCVHDGLYFDAPLDAGNPIFEFVVPEGVSEIPYFCIPHCAFGMVGTIHVETVVAEFLITLDGWQGVPPVSTTGTGTGSAWLTASNRLYWNITFQDLLAAETASHFHGPAGPCANAGVQVGLPLGSPKIGSALLTPTQVTQVLSGLWYVNIHSSLHPAGEIRGRVAPAPLDNPIEQTIPIGGPPVRLTQVAAGLTAPNWGTSAPGDPSRLFVTDQSGVLWAIDLSTGVKTVFLDVTSRLVSLGIFGPGTFDERGLLGVAFHPDYMTNGKLYTYTSEPDAGSPDFTTMPTGVNPNHQTRIIEWQVPDPTNPASVADPDSARELLRIDQPQFNHNAGCLNFGPDGLLYIALGDGGGRDDRDDGQSLGVPLAGHACGGNGQNIESVLGALLRIDPDGNNSANGQYGIPAGNPFVGVAGLDEIYAYGFRNPFRFSFDSMTGDLYLGDVGQNDIEEVNLVTIGGNYGWNYKEGTFTFLFNGNQPGYVSDMPVSMPPGLIDPIAEYDHDDGVSVIGGFVYRGAAMPWLEGRYVFAEFAKTFSNDGRLLYLDDEGNVREFPIFGQGPGVGKSVLGMGQDADGELYVLVNATGFPFGDAGEVLRITAAVGDMDCDGDVDFDDIDPFVLALNGQAAYEAEFPDCQWLHGDIDGDGSVNFDDIDPFVLLFGG